MNNTIQDDAAVIAAVEQILDGYQPASSGIGEPHDDALLPLPLVDDGGGGGGSQC
jgi:hypothetical protein